MARQKKKIAPDTEAGTELSKDVLVSPKKKPGRKKKLYSGYVALIGRTNVGKSTFLNSIMDARVSIVSDKPQTTRKQILGIKTTPKGQIIFCDSPGIHKPYFKLNERMMKDVYQSLRDADLVLYFMEMTDTREDEFALELLKNLEKKVFLLINKIDTVNKARVLQKIDLFKDRFPWAEIIPISARTRLNLDLVEELIFKYLPEHPPYYPEEEFTTQTERFHLAEIIREKLLAETRDELPFTTMIQLGEIKNKETLYYVQADIYVETVSQRKIVIGRRGQRLKSIGEQARKDLENYFDRKVFLDLFVKVVPNWRNSPQVIQEMFD